MRKGAGGGEGASETIPDCRKCLNERPESNRMRVETLTQTKYSVILFLGEVNQNLASH